MREPTEKEFIKRAMYHALVARGIGSYIRGGEQGVPPEGVYPNDTDWLDDIGSAEEAYKFHKLQAYQMVRNAGQLVAAQETSPLDLLTRFKIAVGGVV